MTDTITAKDGTGTATVPTCIDGYAATQRERTIVRPLIGGGVAVTLLPPDPRSGQLELVYPTGAAAETARQLLQRGVLYSLTSTEQPTINMADFAVLSVSPALEDETRAAWIVTVTFQEVTL